MTQPKGEPREREGYKAARSPLGKAAPGEISRDMLDTVLAEGAPEATGLVHGAVDEFAQNLAEVVQRLLALPERQRCVSVSNRGSVARCVLGW